MKKILFVLLIAIPAFSSAQVDNKLVQPPFIEVTGTASKEVVPDQIFISIILSDKVVGNEKYSIEAQEVKLRKALSKINIDLNNLSLSDATSEITKDRKKETGFRVTKEFTLQVKSAAEVSNVFKELYEINIRESSIIKAESTQVEGLRKEVRIAAIKAARDKAEYLVAAIGEQIDKPLEIREQVDNPYYRQNLSNTFLNTRLNDTDTNSTDTDFQRITIKFSYYIKYSIK